MSNEQNYDAQEKNVLPLEGYTNEALDLDQAKLFLDDDDEQQCDDENDLITEQERAELVSGIVAYDNHPIISHPHANKSDTWSIRCGGAVNETEKEYDYFQIYRDSGEGRSITHIKQLFNLSPSSIKQIAEKNYWKERVSDYDRFILVQKVKLEQTNKAKAHIRRLEQYRLQQEMIGRDFSIAAARVAGIANKQLELMLAAGGLVDPEKLPAYLNAAAKLAEVGKSLQAGALGVDALLTALEESDTE